MIHQADGDNKYHSFLYCVFMSSVIKKTMNGLNSIGLIVFSMLGETIAANPVSQQVATIHNKFVLDMTLLNLLLDKFLKNFNVLSKCLFVIVFVFKDESVIVTSRHGFKLRYCQLDWLNQSFWFLRIILTQNEEKKYVSIFQFLFFRGKCKRDHFDQNEVSGLIKKQVFWVFS